MLFARNPPHRRGACYSPVIPPIVGAHAIRPGNFGIAIVVRCNFGVGIGKNEQLKIEPEQGCHHHYHMAPRSRRRGQVLAKSCYGVASCAK